MNSSYLLSVDTFLFGFAALLYISFWVFEKKEWNKIATAVSVVAVIGNGAGFVLRWVESYQVGYGHIPLSNLYESLVFFSFVIALLYLYIEYRYKTTAISCIASTLSCMALTYASLSPNISDKIQPLLPALKSNWLTIHVILCFLGYAGFAVSFGISILYIIKPEDSKKTENKKSFLPSDIILDDLNYKMVVFGFIFLTGGIISGAVWANSAWGTYWSWDPKETWSLITWFVYAIYIHLRLMRGWHGRNLAIMSIVGFAAVLFTYFGVNYLPGLHSYGK